MPASDRQLDRSDAPREKKLKRKVIAPCGSAAPHAQWLAGSSNTKALVWSCSLIRMARAEPGIRFTFIVFVLRDDKRNNALFPLFWEKEICARVLNLYSQKWAGGNGEGPFIYSCRGFVRRVGRLKCL